MLEIKHLSKKFDHKQVLDNVSLSVKEGEIGFLLGASGVGKSTLLRTLNGLEKIDSGTVLFKNKSLLGQPHAAGMVFQQFNLFENMTVAENITFALEKVAKKSMTEAQGIADQLLKKYGLIEKAQLPVQRLSGGQKQRLAIARTLAMKPRIVCMDEPTSALDPLLTNYVAQAIQDLAHEGYCVLVASHDTGLLKQLACTIYLMKDGSIVQSADSRDFFANENSYQYIKEFVHGTIV